MLYERMHFFNVVPVIYVYVDLFFFSINPHHMYSSFSAARLCCCFFQTKFIENKQKKKNIFFLVFQHFWEWKSSKSSINSSTDSNSNLRFISHFKYGTTESNISWVRISLQVKSSLISTAERWTCEWRFVFRWCVYRIRDATENRVEPASFYKNICYFRCWIGKKCKWNWRRWNTCIQSNHSEILYLLWDQNNILCWYRFERVVLLKHYSSFKSTIGRFHDSWERMESAGNRFARRS